MLQRLLRSSTRPLAARLALARPLPTLHRSFTSAPATPPSPPSPPSPPADAPKKQLESKSPLNWKGVAALVLFGGSALLYYQYEIEKKRSQAQATKTLPTLGRPVVGGPFDLVDHAGKRVSDRDFRGKYMLIYFGFTNCPDICPTELNKMTSIMNTIDAALGEIVQPIFITVDPRRDTLPVLAEYRKRYHSRLMALTGPLERLTAVAKAFRIYISTVPADAEDYLVDHSICLYLMDTNGQILEYFGQHMTAEESIIKAVDLIQKDQAALKAGDKKQM